MTTGGAFSVEVTLGIAVLVAAPVGPTDVLAADDCGVAGADVALEFGLGEAGATLLPGLPTVAAPLAVPDVEAGMSTRPDDVEVPDIASRGSVRRSRES